MKKQFKKIYVEITNICNLSCSFCAPSHRKPQHMSPQLFETIATQIAPYTDYVYLHVKGEPLAHPNLAEILDICHAHNLQANITTNGTCLKENTDILINAPALRQLNISLHAETKSHDTYVKNAVEYAKSAATAGKLTSFRLWNGSDGDNNARELGRMFDCNNVQEKRVTLAANIFLSRDSFWEWPDINGDIIAKRGTCGGLRHQIGVLADGSVVPCCLDGDGAQVLGVIGELSFDEIYKNSVLPHRKNMQNSILSLSLCQKCKYREKFNKNLL